MVKPAIRAPSMTTKAAGAPGKREARRGCKSHGTCRATPRACEVRGHSCPARGRISWRGSQNQRLSVYDSVAPSTHTGKSKSPKPELLQDFMLPQISASNPSCQSLTNRRWTRKESAVKSTGSAVNPSHATNVTTRRKHAAFQASAAKTRRVAQEMTKSKQCACSAEEGDQASRKTVHKQDDCR
ncbi:hypothetical protein BaRGS_00039900 [Batillaria attramentaria]|uniref:Uncharacterized protein n=1 Tax=Batillaria attramentaria TaxID=370345 RepID=A0ABD0J1Z3_9CAEN